jgi:carbon-monoxide dehydrogenase catalytic subunit
VTGAPNLVQLLTVDLPQVTGGILSVEKDPIKAVDGILGHIEAKRKKLGM